MVVIPRTSWWTERRIRAYRRARGRAIASLWRDGLGVEQISLYLLVPATLVHAHLVELGFRVPPLSIVPPRPPAAPPRRR